MKKNLDITPLQMEIVIKILRSELPKKSKVWAFGSRSKGVSRRFSDLDLLLDIGKPLNTSLLASLRYAFEESALPYKVDFTDWTTLTASFKSKVEEDLIQI